MNIGFIIVINKKQQKRQLCRFRLFLNYLNFIVEGFCPKLQFYNL